MHKSDLTPMLQSNICSGMAGGWEVVMGGKKLIGISAALFLVALTAAAMPVMAGGGSAYDWTAQTNATMFALYDVSALDPAHVWAVGANGVICFFDGSSWAGQTNPSASNLYDVCAVDLSHVWACGADGTILFYNGSTWATQASGTTDFIRGVYAFDATHAWAVVDGAQHYILFFDGTSWKKQSGELGETILAISGSGTDNVWAGGNNGKLFRFDGQSWKAKSSGTSGQILDISCLGPSSAWLATSSPQIRHFNGSSWQLAHTPAISVHGFTAFDDTHAWVYGDNGAIEYFNGDVWNLETPLTSFELNGASACDYDHVWVVGGGAWTIFGAPPYKSTWYLAEGSTAWGYSSYLSIENPTTAAATAKMTYMTSGGPVDGGTVSMPAYSQTTVNPAGKIGAQDFSTKVECVEGRQIAVDRTMRWTGPGAASEEGHSSIGVTSPAKTWYLPEGSSTWGFECWLLVQNPNASAATCTISYLTDGSPPATRTETIPANSRRSYNMADTIGSKDASIKVRSNLPVIPERAMYRNSRREGHDSIGTTTPFSDYMLAEGTSAWGFTTYILVENPNDRLATVNVTYMKPSGPALQPAFAMPPNSRRTIRVNDVLPNTDFSTRVSSSEPIIAERAMYWDNGTGEATHDSIGVPGVYSDFFFPDGETSNGRETWTLIQNPNMLSVDVDIFYYTPTGAGNVHFLETIPSYSRRSFNMADKGITGRAAVFVSVHAGANKVNAERSMYWNSRGAGTDTIGGF